MMKIETVKKFDGLNKNGGKNFLMVKAKAEPKEVNEKKEKREGVNFSLVIDTSVSMNESAFKKEDVNTKSISRLDMVKMSSIELIDELSDDDTLSIVSFNVNADLKLEPKKMTKENKLIAKSIVQGLTVGYATNLYAGWYEGIKNVIKSAENYQSNRVILLTDGEVNVGISNNNDIIKNVEKLDNINISTTCIGIGAKFNEELLFEMARAGKGNFYYITKELSFDKVIFNELNDLSTVCAKNVTVSIDVPSGIKVKQMTKFKSMGSTYSLPNVFEGKEYELCFELENESLNVDEVEIKVVLSAESTDGEKFKAESIMSLKVLGADDFSKLKENKEAYKKEMELVAATLEFALREKVKTGVNIKTQDFKKLKDFYEENRGVFGDKVFENKIYALNQEESMLNSGNMDMLSKSLYTRSAVATYNSTSIK